MWKAMSSPPLRWERRETRRCLQANKESGDSLLENCCGLTELTCVVRWRKPHQAWDVRAARTLETSNQSCDASVETLESWQCAGDTQIGLATLIDSKENLVGTRSPRRATIALSSGDAELVAALPGACKGLSLRQQWNWLLKFGWNAEETNETTQQILWQQWSARPVVRFVQVETSYMLADCLTKIQSTTKFGPLLETLIGHHMQS